MGNGLTINFKFGSGLIVLMVTQPLALALSKHWVAWPLVEFESLPKNLCPLCKHTGPVPLAWVLEGSLIPLSFIKLKVTMENATAVTPGVWWGERPWCGLSCLYRGQEDSTAAESACKTAVAPSCPSLSTSEKPAGAVGRHVWVSVSDAQPCGSVIISRGTIQMTGGCTVCTPHLGVDCQAECSGFGCSSPQEGTQRSEAVILTWTSQSLYHPLAGASWAQRLWDRCKGKGHVLSLLGCPNLSSTLPSQSPTRVLLPSVFGTNRMRPSLVQKQRKSLVFNRRMRGLNLHYRTGVPNPQTMDWCLTLD